VGWAWCFVCVGFRSLVVRSFGFVCIMFVVLLFVCWFLLGSIFC